MTLRTAFCDLVGIDLPVVQAPIGGPSRPALAAAVSNAGGLGVQAVSWDRPDQLERRLAKTRELTSKPFGINVVLEWPQHDRVAQCLAAGVRVISTFWGDPAPYTDMIHQAGAIHIHTVGSAAEARDAVAAGVDVIVAQGWEAGGHVRGEVSTLALVPAVADAVAPVPVLAAGGIADGRGLAAVLALGADAAWIGTRFLLADEAATGPAYRDALITAAETDTAHGIVFDKGWPDAPHRAPAQQHRARMGSRRPPRTRAPPRGERRGRHLARRPERATLRRPRTPRRCHRRHRSHGPVRGPRNRPAARTQPAAQIVADLVEHCHARLTRW
ncbi:NAD(P)H-dependent flavin oxidoreductase [Kibdelosporangium aridum]|uniref:Nitronate monooxygenase n=1 Tax=Kibdelosporangium aridum TaxID=2030 RepID=A0A1Y5X558_KIBAR|nr:nitronate monooxygenase [Kibdelosporangium aridum]SMC71781.1 nitronate monooxygenase [Kibdelosporangium aridum]